MIKTDSGFYIPASEVAYIKDGYAYLFNGAKVRLSDNFDHGTESNPPNIRQKTKE